MLCRVVTSCCWHICMAPNLGIKGSMCLVICRPSPVTPKLIRNGNSCTSACTQLRSIVVPGKIMLRLGDKWIGSSRILKVSCTARFEHGGYYDPCAS